jgi:hypothetical protein
MPGTVTIPLLRRVELNASYLAGFASRTFTLATINVIPYYSATLIVRVHEATWSAIVGPSLFKVEGYGCYPTPEDAREFLDTGVAITASVTDSVTLPGKGTGVDSDLPPAYKFIATLTQGGNAGDGLFVVASADLVLRAA